jgi:hypothetical protein
VVGLTAIATTFPPGNSMGLQSQYRLFYHKEMTLTSIKKIAMLSIAAIFILDCIKVSKHKIRS